MFKKYNYRLTKGNLRYIPKNFMHDLKMCKQRIQKGWCEDDVWNINSWFLNIVPDMLQYLKENRVGSPAFLDKSSDEEVDCHKIWDDILDEMIFDLRESAEKTCSKKNKYEDEYMAILEEFINKYGFFGEGLQTEKEKEDAEKTGCHVMHFVREIPEYAEIDKKYFDEELRLEKYRSRMKNKGLKLFCKYFTDLWD